MASHRLICIEQARETFITFGQRERERVIIGGTAARSLLTCNLVWISVHPTLHLAKTTSLSSSLIHSHQESCPPLWVGNVQ